MVPFTKRIWYHFPWQYGTIFSINMVPFSITIWYHILFGFRPYWKTVRLRPVFKISLFQSQKGYSYFVPLIRGGILEPTDYTEKIRNHCFSFARYAHLSSGFWVFLRKDATLTNPRTSAQGRFCFAVSSPSMTDLRRDKSMNISTSRTVLHAASHGHISGPAGLVD